MFSSLGFVMFVLAALGSIYLQCRSWSCVCKDHDVVQKNEWRMEPCHPSPSSSLTLPSSFQSQQPFCCRASSCCMFYCFLFPTSPTSSSSLSVAFHFFKDYNDLLSLEKVTEAFMSWVFEPSRRFLRVHDCWCLLETFSLRWGSLVPPGASEWGRLSGSLSMSHIQKYLPISLLATKCSADWM